MINSPTLYVHLSGIINTILADFFLLMPAISMFSIMYLADAFKASAKDIFSPEVRELWHRCRELRLHVEPYVRGGCGIEDFLFSLQHERSN